ncbi:sigma-54-dependent Fis family transcriptional regulator [Lichenicoccus sp.]|uniref:sigma-54-dependent Fis family transcriptional regulator n=1 Tax=Lichenicoccus sp. TaxID=2781899 RepID=UPI003D0AB9AA
MVEDNVLNPADPRSAQAVAERLGRARLLLERSGVAQLDLLPPDIFASWQRCLDAGLEPHKPKPLVEISAPELAAARQRADLVRRLALAEMRALYSQIAGSNFLIAFADANGVLLDTIADPSFRAAARTANIQPGTLWTEQICGTNALGTVARSGRPLTVHGGEHFFARHGSLTCTAAPIFGPDGTLNGVLDASSHSGSRQQHTRALVRMAATGIENGLFRHHHQGHLIVAFHHRGEYLHTLSAGLLALAPDGTLLGANAQASLLLQGLPTSPGRHFDDLFRTRFETVILRVQAHERLNLEDRVGSAVVATIENLPQHARAARLPRPTPVPAVPEAAFVAEDPAIVALLRVITAGARRRLPILIRGETGTGKEQLARFAHQASGRQGAFVPVNCAALSDTLIEAELFGHAEGAFTGARRGGARGLVCEADGGTLFLDEIGDMPLTLQATLLRLLDDWMVRPVGGGRTRQVNVLLIAATNAPLEEAIQSGRFRADLYYRLNGVDLALPALRDRQDFAAIACRLLSDIAPASTLSDAAILRLSRGSWPGNIRELRSILLRLTLTDPGRRIDLAAVESLLGDQTPSKPAADPGLRGIMRARIIAAHRDAGGNLSETARRLGVSRNTIYRAIQGCAAASRAV